MKIKRVLLNFYKVLCIASFLGFFFSCDPSIAEEGIIESHYRIEQLLYYNLPTDERYAQGMDIYDGLVFQAFSDGTIDIYSLTDCRYSQTISLPKDASGELYHCNDLFIDGGNGGVMMWLPSNSANGPIVGFGLQKENGAFSIKDEHIVAEPELPNIDLFKAVSQYVGDNSYCVQVAYKKTPDDWYGDVVIIGYSYNGLVEDVAYEKKWEIHHEKLWAMQGGCFKDDFFYLTVGVSQGEAKIYRIDLNSGVIECFINFRGINFSVPYGEEMQGLAYYFGSFYFSTTHGLYKLSII